MNTSVKYELEELETLLSPGRIDGAPTGKQVASEVERIKKSLVQEVFSFEDERHLERYIQYHQQALIRLLDDAFSQNLTLPDGSISRELEELLTFIERHFTKYFDQDAKAPDSYVNSVRRSTRTNAKKIFRDLTEFNADQRLIEVALQPLAKINDRTSRIAVTYRKIMYVKEVQRELLKLIDKPPIDNINEEVTKLIYYLNYNSTKSLVYHAHLVNQIDKASETTAEKIERLSLLLKHINQAQLKPGIAYNPRASSVKEQVNNYIAEEIEYLERISVLNSQVVDRRDNPSSTFRIKMDISVSQLSYLLKIMLGTAIIQNTNVNELLRFVSKIVVTKKSEGISYDSLRAKFYNVELNTKNAVREMLSLLSIHVDKDL